MHDSQQVLVISALVFMIIATMTIFGKGVYAYGAIGGGRKFNYHFHKERVPLCVGVIVALALFSLCYGLIISGDIAQAAWFCLLISSFGSISCFINICLVYKD